MHRSFVGPRSRFAPWGSAGRYLIAAFCLVTFLVMAPTAAYAEDPVDLGGADMLDTVGALTGHESDVQAAVDKLYDETGVQLFVVFVDNFGGVADGESWAVATSDANGLGNDDILFAVATGDRNYDFRYPADFSLDENTTRAVEDEVVPFLRNGDWAGAAVAAANGYDDALTGGGFPWGLVLGALVVVGVIILLIVLAARRRRTVANATEPGRLDQKQLDLRVGSLLVQLDDSVTTSGQELGFAIAQFGDEASKPFVAALESAKAKVAEAFQLKQQLDDAIPETDEQKRAVSLRIIALCEEADGELDAQADAFDELRDLEKTAPAALVAVRADAHELSTRLDAATASVNELREHYSPVAVSTVADNPGKAAKLLQFVGTAGEAADGAITAGKVGDAAVAVRTARASVGQAGQLLDAIDSLAARLADASAKLDAAIADTRQDLAAARALQANASSAALAPAIAAADAAVSSATDGPASGDPVSRLAKIEEANAELDRVFGATRDARLNVERAAVALEGTLATARGQIGAANDYISTRRGGVGEIPRTRLAEATRHLDSAVALSTSDPVAALAEAQQATSLASSAVNSAQYDVNAYTATTWGTGGSGRYSGNGSEEADLGGLLGMLLAGGGNRGGGFWSSGGGGGNRGWSGGGFGGGFGGISRGGGSSRSGGFGGSSRSSSRGSFGSSSRSSSRSSRGRF